MKIIAAYSPAACEPLGHPIYAKRLGFYLAKEFKMRLFSLKHEKLNEEMRNVGWDLQISETFEAGAIDKDKFIKYGPLARVMFGLAKFRFNYKLLKEFYSKNTDVDLYQLFEFEYIAAFLYLVPRPKLLSKTILGIHAVGFHWVKGRSIVINLYKGVLLPKMIKMLVKGCKCITLKGYFLRQDFIESLHLKEYEDKIKITGWGNDNEVNTITKAEACKKLNIDEDKFYGLYFGVIRESKGFTELLQNLHKMDKRITLLIAGALWDIKEEDVLELANDPKIKDRVILHFKFIEEDDIPYYYSAADFVFLPHKKSTYAFSGPLSLSVQYQRPVICSDIGELGLFTNKHQIGRTFKCENWPDFVEQTNALAEEIKEGKYNNDIFKQAMNDNSWETISGRIKSIYNS